MGGGSGGDGRAGGCGVYGGWWLWWKHMYVCIFAKMQTYICFLILCGKSERRPSYGVVNR